LLWGNDGGNLITQTTDVPGDYIQFLGERIERVWRVTETGETGDLTIVVDVTGIQFGNPNDYELLIDADGVFTTGATRISGVLTGDLITFTVIGADLYDGAYFTIGNSKESYIYSVVDGQNWNDPSTWNCECVPDATDMFVAIIDGHTVNVTDAQEVGFLEVTSGTTLAIQNGGSLAVKTDLMVAGTLSSAINGTLTFDGSVDQNLNGIGTVTLGNLVVNNGQSLTLAHSSYLINGVLTPTSGLLDFAGVPFTFVSNATSTASIGVIGAGASFANTSNIRVQRHINAGAAAYRNLGTPLNAMALRQWDDELFISGPGFPDGCAYSTTGCFASARYWRADLQAYRAFTDIDSSLLNTFGLEIYLGDNTTSFSATTLTSTGTPNFSLSTNAAVWNGWNLIANPFMSSINFHNVIRNIGTIGNYFYVYNPDTKAFEWYDAASFTSSSNWTNGGVLSSSQGFWVYNSGGASSITFNQSSKTFGVDGFFKQLNPNQLKVKIAEADALDGAAGVVEFSDVASIDFEEDKDVVAFPFEIQPTNQLYTKSGDGQRLVLNNQPNETSCIKIPLFMDVVSANEFKLQFEELPQGYTCYLVDEKLNTLSKIDLDAKVYFEAQAGQEQNRFSVVMTKNGQNCEILEDNYATKFKVHAYQNTVFLALEGEMTDFTVEVKNLLGQTVYNSKVYSNTSYEQIVVDVIDGIYLVEVKSVFGDVVSTNKVFINR
jgi:hypothetical protein